ncbi:McrB family protein, partial [Campylobacter jejuni]
VIDEINRGNVSKIFGELITLIEPSKRIGEKEELKVKLPYSGEEFGVPKNVYIIGTMNTADRSITSLDTALRRRFEFIEMMPDVSKLSMDCEGINLQELLKAINTRIEYLLDREKTIGHAFFISVENLESLKKVFKNRIIPLLQEYFYNDYALIDAVLNKNGMLEISVENKDYLKNMTEFI